MTLVLYRVSWWVLSLVQSIFTQISSISKQWIDFPCAFLNNFVAWNLNLHSKFICIIFPGDQWWPESPKNHSYNPQNVTHPSFLSVFLSVFLNKYGWMPTPLQSVCHSRKPAWGCWIASRRRNEKETITKDCAVLWQKYAKCPVRIEKIVIVSGRSHNFELGRPL